MQKSHFNPQKVEKACNSATTLHLVQSSKRILESAEFETKARFKGTLARAPLQNAF